MSKDRWTGLMLMAGSAGALITLALHPSGRELFSAATFEAAARQLVMVHSLALAAMPLWFTGAIGLSRRVANSGDTERQLGLTAVVFYGFGLAAMMTGVVFDGLVSPGLAGQINATTGTVGQGWRIAFNYNSMLDMAFMHVFLGASSLALGLWSAAMIKGGALPRWWGIVGGILATAALIGLVSGQIDRNMQLFSVVFFGQAAWFFVTGGLLWRREDAAPA